MTRLKYFIFIVVACSTLFSCTDKNIVFETATALDSDWDRNDELNFEFNINDTTKTYGLSCILRNSHEYTFCNLYLNYKITDEKGTNLMSNFQELLLYSPTSGKPLGKEQLLSDIQEGSYLLVSNLKFKSTGKYTIGITHQMRDNQELNGLESVGVQVVKE